MDDELIKIIFLIGVYVVGGFVLVLFVILNSSIRLKPYKTKKPQKDWKIKAMRDTASWAAENNFDFLGFYTVHYGMRGFMAAWESKEKPTYLCHYIIGTRKEVAIARDFTTCFENEIRLTTVNTKDANFLPKPPGEYSQSFSKCSFDELLIRHRESEEYLITRGGAKLRKSQIAFEEDFIDSLKKENRYHWKHWYWIFLIFYFHFVRRYRRHNKSIKKQHELGMIKLPNEIFIK